MLDTEREAKGLMHDPSSWSQGGIRHKAYRAMQLTEEEEVPRHRSLRKGKKKHVHRWGPWNKLREERRRSLRWTGRSYRQGSPYTVYVFTRSCKRCGLRDEGRSGTPSPGDIQGRYYYWG
jgi:hypothetical protein